MVLATPGVNVNAVMENKCNAAFFAVKSGTPKTLDLLIEAGINMQQRDCYGRTVLYNALEYPNPEMLRRVLNHVPVT
jgi:ankyrin repeat protein